MGEQPCGGGRACLCTSFENGHVAVAEDVFLAFDAVFTGISRGGGAAEADEVFVGNDFGLDEVFLEIAMNHAGGLGGFPAFLDRPAADLFFAGGEVGLQTEEGVAAADEVGDARVCDAEVLEELFGLFGGEVDEFGLDAGADGHVGGIVVGLHEGGDFLHEGVGLGVGQIAFGDVAGVEDGLGGEQLEILEQLFLVVCAIEDVGRFVLVEVGNEFFQDGEFGLGVFVAGLGELLGLAEAFLDGVEVGEDELGDDNLDVADGIDGAHGVDDVRVFEAAHDVDDGVGFTDVGEELVAEAFAFAGAGDEAGDVHELDGGGDDDLGFGDVLKYVGAIVWHHDDAHVGVDGAERVVRGLGLAGAGEGVEESGLTHVGETDDSGFHKGSGSARRGQAVKVCLRSGGSEGCGYVEKHGFVNSVGVGQVEAGSA